MAVATSLQPEDITRIAEEIQKKFVEECKDDDTVDPRDYKRVKTCLPYVCKFVRHKMGNSEEAYQMMVDAMKWRKTFGVQDMELDKIDTVYFERGVGIPHGEDRDGSLLVILNCHLHKKDAKKFPQLQKFFVFCLESHMRRFPDKKVTMLFNMSECGISNMDMEFVRFIISCFKNYFPDMLNYLLVFEMPWVLQAAWKIIKGWLGEAAIRKIKFVTKSDITEYISPDQLLVQFGGSDSWTYQYDLEELREQAKEVWDCDPLIAEDSEDDEYEDEQSTEESLKQVRFASGQPPSRQSRFGSQEEVDTPTPSTGGNQLRRGTASSPGYRRRQVSRLMSTQKSSSDRDHDQVTRSLPPIMERHQLLLAPPTTILKINPMEELLFKGPVGEELLCNVVLTNITDSVVAYKIKTTAPNRYKVRPNINLVEGGDSANIQVKLLSGSSEIISQDKFLVQAYQFSTGAQPPDTAQLPSFWKSLARDRSVEEYRLKCRYVHEKAVSNTDSHQPETGPSLVVLQNKVDQVAASVIRLQKTVDRVLYLCIALLIVLLVTNIFF